VTCANATCRAALPATHRGRRRIYCSERCRLIVRVRAQQKPKDDLDAFFTTQRRRFRGKLDGCARRIQAAQMGSYVAWNDTRDWVLVQHRRA
jgi:hypothetical protein